MTYDNKCLDLAAYFLADPHDTDDERDDLAQTIQGAIEDWLGDRDRSATHSQANRIEQP